MPKQDTLVVNDWHPELAAKFVEEMGEGVKLAKSAREVAQKAVRQPPISSSSTEQINDEHVLSMI